ncbi:MAG: hypothetical protein HY539_06390 [Deltaproteobacteria bacterium]|nr:hypothetical protein [Deltaproteobacteria bacterium]
MKLTTFVIVSLIFFTSFHSKLFAGPGGPSENSEDLEWQTMESEKKKVAPKIKTTTPPQKPEPAPPPPPTSPEQQQKIEAVLQSPPSAVKPVPLPLTRDIPPAPPKEEEKPALPPEPVDPANPPPVIMPSEAPKPTQVQP